MSDKKIIKETNPTDKVKAYLANNSYEDTAELIGITRTTLYSRLKNHKWKKGELALIDKI